MNPSPVSRFLRRPNKWSASWGKVFASLLGKSAPRLAEETEVEQYKRGLLMFVAGKCWEVN